MKSNGRIYSSAPTTSTAYDGPGTSREAVRHSPASYPYAIPHSYTAWQSDDEDESDAIDNTPLWGPARVETLTGGVSARPASPLSVVSDRWMPGLINDAGGSSRDQEETITFTNTSDGHDRADDANRDEDDAGRQQHEHTSSAVTDPDFLAAARRLRELPAKIQTLKNLDQALAEKLERSLPSSSPASDGWASELSEWFHYAGSGHQSGNDEYEESLASRELLAGEIDELEKEYLGLLVAEHLGLCLERLRTFEEARKEHSKRDEKDFAEQSDLKSDVALARWAYAAICRTTPRSMPWYATLLLLLNAGHRFAAYNGTLRSLYESQSLMFASDLHSNAIPMPGSSASTREQPNREAASPANSATPSRLTSLTMLLPFLKNYLPVPTTEEFAMSELGATSSESPPPVSEYPSMSGAATFAAGLMRPIRRHPLISMGIGLGGLAGVTLSWLKPWKSKLADEVQPTTSFPDVTGRDGITHAHNISTRAQEPATDSRHSPATPNQSISSVPDSKEDYPMDAPQEAWPYARNDAMPASEDLPSFVDADNDYLPTDKRAWQQNRPGLSTHSYVNPSGFIYVTRNTSIVFRGGANDAMDAPFIMFGYPFRNRPYTVSIDVREYAEAYSGKSVLRHGMAIDSSMHGPVLEYLRWDTADIAFTIQASPTELNATRISIDAQIDRMEPSEAQLKKLRNKTQQAIDLAIRARRSDIRVEPPNSPPNLEPIEIVSSPFYPSVLRPGRGNINLILVLEHPQDKVILRPQVQSDIWLVLPQFLFGSPRYGNDTRMVDIRSTKTSDKKSAFGINATLTEKIDGRINLSPGSDSKAEYRTVGLYLQNSTCFVAIIASNPKMLTLLDDLQRQQNSLLQSAFESYVSRMTSYESGPIQFSADGDLRTDLVVPAQYQFANIKIASKNGSLKFSGHLGDQMHIVISGTPEAFSVDIGAIAFNNFTRSPSLQLVSVDAENQHALFRDRENYGALHIYSDTDRPDSDASGVIAQVRRDIRNMQSQHNLIMTMLMDRRYENDGIELDRLADAIQPWALALARLFDARHSRSAQPIATTGSGIGETTGSANASQTLAGGRRYLFYANSPSPRRYLLAALLLEAGGRDYRSIPELNWQEAFAAICPTPFQNSKAIKQDMKAVMDNAYSRVLDRAQAGAHIMHFIRELTDQFTVDPQNMQTLFHLMNLGRLLDRMDGIAPSSLDLHLVAHAGPSPSETDGEDTNSGNVLRIANNSLILNGRHGLLPDYLTGPLREPQDILYGMLIFNQTHNLGTPVYREVLFMSLLAESSTTNRRNTTGDFCAANILDRTVPGAGTRHTFPNTTINDGNGTRVNPNIGIRPGSDSPRAGSRNTTDNLDSPFLESDLPRGGPTEYDKWDPNSDLPQNRGRLPPNVFIKLTNTTITRESGEANERSAGQEPTDWGSVAFVGTLAGATMILIGTSAATFTGDSMVQIGGGIVMTTGAVTGAIGAGFAATHLVIGAGAIELGQTLLSFTGTYGGFQAVSMGYALDAAIKAGIITAQEARYAVVVETLGNGMLIAIGTVDTYDAMKAAVAEPTAANIVSVIGNGVATVGGIMGGTPSAVRSMSSQFQVRLGLSEQTLDRLGMAGAGAAVGGLSLLGLNQLPSQQSRGPGSELKRIKTQVKQTWLNTGGLSGRGK